MPRVLPESVSIRGGRASQGHITSTAFRALRAPHCQGCVLHVSLSLFAQSALQEALSNWKHFAQYFKVFADYATLGLLQRAHLLSLNVLSSFASFALTNSFASKYHRPDFGFAQSMKFPLRTHTLAATLPILSTGLFARRMWIHSKTHPPLMMHPA
jgi:hypothetical protein